MLKQKLRSKNRQQNSGKTSLTHKPVYYLKNRFLVVKQSSVLMHGKESASKEVKRKQTCLQVGLILMCPLKSSEIRSLCYPIKLCSRFDCYHFLFPCQLWRMKNNLLTKVQSEILLCEFAFRSSGTCKDTF